MRCYVECIAECRSASCCRTMKVICQNEAMLGSKFFGARVSEYEGWTDVTTSFDFQIAHMCATPAVAPLPMGSLKIALGCTASFRTQYKAVVLVMGAVIRDSQTAHVVKGRSLQRKCIRAWFTCYHVTGQCHLHAHVSDNCNQ